jgi:restriction endonuclease S subunit
MESSLRYLKTVPFSQFYLWDVKRFAKQEISSSFQIVRLGDYITPRNKKVKLFEFPEKEFGILGVNNKEGIFDAYCEKGEKINQPYKKVEVDDLAYNPYRVNVGSIGIKKKHHTNSFISPAYIVFSCLEGLNPEFLYILFKTDTFNAIINENTTGSVRQNLKFETLVNIKVPLPTLEEQNRIVANYKQKNSLADKQIVKANQLEKEIQYYLESSLKIKKNKFQQKSKGLQFVHFKDTSRWDSLFLVGNIASIDSKYPTVKFETVISSFNKGENGKSIRFNSKDYPSEDFRYIGMEHIEKETGQLLELNEVKGKEIKSQTLRVPKGFLLFGKLRPYLNKYWLNETQFNNIICSSEFFVFDIVDSIDKLFFIYVLSSDFIQTQISDKTSGARMPRINESIFYNLQFPLPPLNTQIQISEHINSIKQEIVNLRKLAEQNRTVAVREFENEIFSS